MLWRSLAPLWVHWRSQHSISGWGLDFGPSQGMLFFSSRSVFGIIVLLVERIQALAVGFTFDSKILWCADESMVDSTTARCRGGWRTSALHPRPIVCADTLCLLFVKHGSVHYYQQSPLWSSLLRGHCSTSFYFVSAATLQISNVLPCSFYRGDDVFPNKLLVFTHIDDGPRTSSKNFLFIWLHLELQVNKFSQEPYNDMLPTCAHTELPAFFQTSWGCVLVSSLALP